MPYRHVILANIESCIKAALLRGSSASQSAVDSSGGLRKFVRLDSPRRRALPCEDIGKTKMCLCVRKVRSTEENKEKRTVGIGEFHKTRQCHQTMFQWLRPLNNSLQASAPRNQDYNRNSQQREFSVQQKFQSFSVFFFLRDLVLFGLAQSIPPRLRGFSSVSSSTRLPTIPANVPVSPNEARRPSGSFGLWPLSPAQSSPERRQVNPTPQDPAGSSSRQVHDRRRI